MKRLSCPSCGGPVEFRAGNSVVAICNYCTTTVYRDGEELRNIGKMAALMDDPTPFQIGTEGKYMNRAFTVIGRIQMKYDAGLWNEWHIMFSDMTTGWLGEAMGEFIITMEKPLTQLPDADQIEPGAMILVNGERWHVSDIQDAVCIAGQGELPFQVGAGYEAPTVDLRRDESEAGPGKLTYATLDYSDDPPRFYLGQTLTYKELKLTNLRQDVNIPWLDEGKPASAKTFSCVNCGSPLTRSDRRIATIGCPACASVLDVSNETVQLMQQAQQALDTPLLIPLGSKGKLDDVQWDVIGHMRREAHGMFSWSEYLLHNPKDGFTWLIESGQHWTHMKMCNPPAGGNNAQIYKIKGEEYKEFDEYPSKVVHVLGEFYWRVKKGEEAYVKDWIAPPMMLSRERMEKEVTWSSGTYLTNTQVQEAFKLKTALPEPTGVAPNQPNPHLERNKSLWRWFRWLFVIALVAHLFYACTSRSILKDSFNASPEQQTLLTPKLAPDAQVPDVNLRGPSGKPGSGQAPTPKPGSGPKLVDGPSDAAKAASAPDGQPQLAPLNEQGMPINGIQSYLTKPFKISGTRGNVVVKVNTDVTNTGIDVVYLLVNTKTAEKWQAGTEIEYYEGYDDGDRWTEGQRDAKLVLNNVPPGDYQLEVLTDMPATPSQTVAVQFTLERGSVSWFNWVLVTLFLLSFPLMGWWRKNSFESERWAQSSYTESDDDDDE